MKPQFVHLHVHSHYSLLDGTNRIEDLIAAAKKDGQPALALTDHGNLFGAIEFYKAAHASGVKPIIGCEAYIARKSRLEKSDKNLNPTDHLTLLATSDEGYKNLVKLASLAYVEGFHKRPRMDKETLARHSKGLVALSGCLSGEVNRKNLSDDGKGALSAAMEYADLFGKENFFLEVMRNGIERQETAGQRLYELAQSTGLPLVATNDVHYLNQNDSSVQEVLLCISTGKTLSEEKRMRMETDRLFFTSAAEMAELFRDYPQAIQNTLAIAERANINIELGKYHLPVFDAGPGRKPEQLFEELCEKGFAKRYPNPPAGAKERLIRESAVIRQMGFVSYFLIVWDFIRFAKENGVPVGPGRGSAAGSIVAYCLEITDVDPLRYDLLFERFLNSERISMPDIDIDFCRDGRERVIQYVREKYGQANVSQIVTFGTMAAKLALRDVGRVLEIPLREVDRITKKIPLGPNVELAQTIDSDKELQEIRDSDPRFTKLFDNALRLEGLIRHASTHAAGVVLADRPLDELVPLYRNQDDITTQYDMNALEAVGLLKMDFLGLKTLTILNKACQLIEKNRSLKLDLASLPFNDRKTYELLAAGDSFGVFQLESEGMRKLLQRLKPDCFEDLIALLSLYRPGPLGSGMVDSFVRRKHGEEKASYPHPLLEEVLKETYGVIVYQEQVMRIAARLAGFSLNQADSLRKAMGKKKPEIMQKFRKEFIDGAGKNGVPEAKAGEIWDLMEYFAGYGFNKSHSTAYAVLTYQTAYLKANYCLEFLSANLSCEISDSDKVKAFVDEAKKHGLRVLAPDISNSQIDFSVENGSIRFGLLAVKGVGERAAEEIVKTRQRLGPYESLHQVCEEVDSQFLNKSTLEALIKSGAFDFVGWTRWALCAELESAMQSGSRIQKDRRSGQKNLFDTFLEASSNRTKIQRTPPACPNWTEMERLMAEKESLGFYLSGHPLAGKTEILRAVSSANSQSLKQKREGEEVLMAGLVTSLQIKTIQQGRFAGRKMARLRLEDLEGSVSAIVFSDSYDKHRERIVEDQILVARASIDLSGEEAGLRISDVYTLDEALQSLEGGVLLRLGNHQSELMPQLAKLIEQHRGSQAVYLDLLDENGNKKRLRTGKDFRVRLSEKWGLEAKSLLGEGSVQFIGPARLR